MSVSAASTTTVQEDEVDDCGPQPLARLEVSTGHFVHTREYFWTKLLYKKLIVENRHATTSLL